MINSRLMNGDNKFLRGNPLVHRLLAVSFMIATLIGTGYLIICFIIIIVRLVIAAWSAIFPICC